MMVYFVSPAPLTVTAGDVKMAVGPFGPAWCLHPFRNTFESASGGERVAIVSTPWGKPQAIQAQASARAANGGVGGWTRDCGRSFGSHRRTPCLTGRVRDCP